VNTKGWYNLVLFTGSINRKSYMRRDYKHNIARYILGKWYRDYHYLWDGGTGSIDGVDSVCYNCSQLVAGLPAVYYDF